MTEDEQKRKLALMIADVIQQLLRESDELADILGRAQEEGYDIFLSIFSGIVIRRREEAHGEGGKRAAKEESLPLKFEFTKSDREFLKSIGIQVPD